MSIISTIIKTMLRMVFIAFVSLAVAFILTIIMPENVQKAIEIIKGIL